MQIRKLSQREVAAWITVSLFGVFTISTIFGFNLAFYLLAAVLSFAAALIYPSAGLAAGLCLTIIFAKAFSLQPIVLGDNAYKFYPLDVFLIGAYLGVLFRLFSGAIRWQLKKADILLGLFILSAFVYFLISIGLWQGNFALAFSSFKNYAFYPAIFWVTYLALDRSDKSQEYIRMIFAGILAILVFLFYGVIMGKGLWTDITPLSTPGVRLLDFSHAFYLSLAVLIGGALLAVYNSNKRYRAWFWLLPLFGFGVIVSLMRHLWLALFLGIIVVVWLLPREFRVTYRRLLVSYGLSALALIFMLLLVGNVFPDTTFGRKLISAQSNLLTRAVSVSDTGDSSISWRGFVWKGVLQEYKASPFLGLGFGQKIFLEMPDYTDYVEIRNIHNSFLAIFVQMGIIPFIIFVMFCWNIFKQIYQAKQIDIAWRAGLGAMMVFCAAAFMFQPYLEINLFNVIFWSLLGYSRRLCEGFTS